MKLRVQVLISLCIAVLLGLANGSRTVETLPHPVPDPAPRLVPNVGGPKAAYFPSGLEMTRINDHESEARLGDAIARFDQSGRPYIKVDCTPFQIDGSPASGIMLRASFLVSGATIREPEFVTLTLTTEDRRNLLGRRLMIYSKEHGLLVSSQLKAAGTQDRKSVSVNVGFDVIKDMATSTVIDIQAGSYEAQLVDSEIYRLKAMMAMVESGLSF